MSFSLQAGRTLAVVGESGSGKSTLARLLTLIENPTAGALLIDGEDVANASAAKRKRLRREVQIVFQNPYGSLNPRQTIGKALEEPLLVNTRLSAAERKAEASRSWTRSGLRPEYYHRYPHMFSGGQRQRIAIARALMLQAADPGARRAGVGARRVDPGPGAQPPGRACRRSSALAYLFV